MGVLSTSDTIHICPKCTQPAAAGEPKSREVTHIHHCATASSTSMGRFLSSVRRSESISLWSFRCDFPMYLYHSEITISTAKSIRYAQVIAWHKSKSKSKSKSTSLCQESLSGHRTYLLFLLPFSFAFSLALALLWLHRGFHLCALLLCLRFNPDQDGTCDGTCQPCNNAANTQSRSAGQARTHARMRTRRS